MLQGNKVVSTIVDQKAKKYHTLLYNFGLIMSYTLDGVYLIFITFQNINLNTIFIILK